MNLRISRQEWAWGLKVSIPVALCLVTGAIALFGEEEDTVIGRGKVVAAGFSGKWGEKGQGKRMRTREARDAAVAKMRLRRPAGIDASSEGLFRGEGSGKVDPMYRDVDFASERVGWEYLERGVRGQIDSAQLEFGRWSGIVIHGSGTEGGNAETLGFYHRNVKGLRDGMAYHFVLGNGTHSKMGEVEVGERWVEQSVGKLTGRRGEGEGGLIEICLIGDFDRGVVAVEQLEALDELVDYLRAKVGEVPIELHEVNGGRDHGCLGSQFPRALVLGHGA
ncbi:MAG: hypothetical protein P8J87_07165 [Verrucomicrobiales bacterium]|nr:hypothetical protein [Verrucomicrobiales bacterium]